MVEDDADIAGVLRRSLDKEGYEVRVAGDGEAALAESGVFEPDAVVLDLGLPKLDGVEVCRRIREEADVPILMLTARDAVDARVEGLDSGADDYLVKPFERAELLARLRALLRRRPPRGSAFLVAGDLRLNPDTHEVFRGERTLELTAREFELLEHLMRNERIVVSRQALLDEVWGYHPFAETNTVDVFISNLRRKLEAGGEPRLLHTVRGAGYVLRAEPEGAPSGSAEGRRVSAALTFAILCLFSAVIGALAEQRIRTGFDDDLRATAADLQDRLQDSITRTGSDGQITLRTEPLLYASAGDAAVRVVSQRGRVMFPPPPSGSVDLGATTPEGVHDVGPTASSPDRSWPARSGPGRSPTRSAARWRRRSRTSSTASRRAASRRRSTRSACSSASA